MKGLYSFIRHGYIILAVCTVIHAACSSHSSGVDTTDGTVYTLTTDGIILRSGPGEQFEKIINKKATEVLHKIQYAEVDKSVRVMIDEVSGQWSKIRVVDPAWLENSHIGWVQTRYLIEPGAVPKPVSTRRKLMLFNDISLIRSRLSESGIGWLHEWKRDEIGYMSITDYYRFGEPSVQNGMNNNLAYYLESKNENYVETLSLVLNINNSAEERQAIERFVQVTKKTFRAIDVYIPGGLLAAIKGKEAFVYEGESFKTKLELEKSKIETLKLIVYAKGLW